MFIYLFSLTRTHEISTEQVVDMTFTVGPTITLSTTVYTSHSTASSEIILTCRGMICICYYSYVIWMICFKKIYSFKHGFKWFDQFLNWLYSY